MTPSALKNIYGQIKKKCLIKKLKQAISCYITRFKTVELYLALIDECILVIGPMDITDETRSDIRETIASERKELLDGKENSQDLIRKLSISIFRLIVSSREYQRC